MTTNPPLTDQEREELRKAGEALPVNLPGHWNTPEGLEKARETAAEPRERLHMARHSDFAIANAIFMVGRGDLELIALQTAAKERIRWLSVQLAIRNALLAAREAEIKRLKDANAKLKILLKERTEDIARTQPDPSMPRLSTEAITTLADSAEAWAAMAMSRKERIEATALEMLVTWQKAARAALSTDKGENKL